MKAVFYAIFAALIALNVYFGTYAAIHGDVHFFNDVARDFLLLREIDEKKIILIGPRSNAVGLFHGVLWSYLNYPAYRLGGGNPVVVSWFWITLASASMGVGFYGAKKLFGMFPALAFVLLYSTNLITHLYGIFHGDAPIFLTPILLFSIMLYVKTKKLRFVALHLLTAALIMQLNIGVGIPIVTLSAGLSLFLMIRYKKWKHLVSFLQIPLVLSTFIVFDLRHDFFLTKAAYAFWQFTRYWHPISTDFFIRNRLETLLDLHIVQASTFPAAVFIFLLVVLASIITIKMSKKYRTVYVVILYFYFGYMAMMLLEKGVILSHFVYFLIPLTSLWFASFLRGKWLILFFPILVVATFYNVREGNSFVQYLKTSFIEKRPESWRSTNRLAEGVIARQWGKPSFGYFVFSPDAFAYGPRYAMIYHFRNANLNAHEYEKLETTYIIASPPPDNDPYMTYVWWRKNPVKITKDPVWTQKFPGGYTAEEYTLSVKEQQIPHDKTIELGIHFR
jgi:hypothetical protein